MIMVTIAFILGLILCLLFGVPYIDFLHKKMMGQYVLELAPEAHKQKQGTPTTGGVFIVTAIILASMIVLALAQKLNTTGFIILMTLFFYTLAGFQDDYLKIKGKANQGLTPKAKLIRQIVIAFLPAIFIPLCGEQFTRVSFAYHYIDLLWFYPFFAVFIIIGSSNAFNLTDGLDGLATSCGIPVFLACSIVAGLNSYIEVSIISAATAGALIGFLNYNKAKAQVFMGDTGSLALGGLLGTLAVMGKFELLLIIMAFVFICETLSVIIQVTSFRLTGKRVFKMAPIHHHFELLGWSENRIVITFGIVSMLCSILSVVLFILYFKGII